MKQEYSIGNYSREKSEINQSVDKINILNVKEIDFNYPLSLQYKIYT